MSEREAQREEASSSKPSIDISGILLKRLYEEKLNDYKQRIEELKDPKVIYVTDLVYCPLKREFRKEFTELVFQFEPYLLMGEIVHKGVEELLADIGYEIEKEISLTLNIDGEELIIKGRIDAYSPQNIVEIKSARSAANIPQEHHLMQLKLYMAITGVHSGTLIYVTPDRFAEYNVSSKGIEIAEVVKRFLRMEKIPQWGWECKHCPFAGFCPYKLTSSLLER